MNAFDIKEHLKKCLKLLKTNFRQEFVGLKSI